MAAHRCVGFDDAQITADDQPVQAVSQNPADKAGDRIAGLAIGTTYTVASGVVNKGDLLVSAANGGVKKAPVDPSNPFARALSTADDGELVEILIR